MKETQIYNADVRNKDKRNADKKMPGKKNGMSEGSRILAGSKNRLAVLCVILCCCLTGGCGQKEPYMVSQAKDGPVKIPMIFLIDAATGKRENEDLVNAFNKAYAGIYEAEVEWMAITSGEYRSNLKRWNVADELPAVITDACFSPAFYELLLKDGRLADLASFIDQDAEWKEAFDPDMLETCREADDSLYICPTASNCFSYAGIFYHKQLFQKAGIGQFPETWDDFFACCNKLEQAGIVPVGLHTAGTAWTPMLFATAYLGTSKEGRAFMQERLPQNYSGKAGRDLVAMLEKIHQHTSLDGIYQDFDVPYNQFIHEETAMLPNGFWMLLQFSDVKMETIGFAPFPENVMVASAQSSGWGIVSSYPKEVQEGAAAFLKFRTLETCRQAEEFLNEQREDITPLEKDYIRAVNGEPVVIPNYQFQWNPILQEQVLTEELPGLLYHTIDAEQFLEAMNESARRYREE